MAGLAERVDELRRLVKTDPDPRVRRRAQAVLMLAQGASVVGVARWFRTAPHRVRAWRAWFLDGGRDRLGRRPPPRPPAEAGPRRPDVAGRGAAAGARGRTAGRSPSGASGTCGSCSASGAASRVSVFTVHRAVWGLGLPLPPAAARPDAPAGRGGGRLRAGGAGVAGKRARAGQGKPGAFRLVYLDECEVHRHPRLTRLWRRRGTTLRVPAAGEDAKLRRVRRRWTTPSGRVVWRTAATKDGAAFVRFLDHLAAAFPDGPGAGRPRQRGLPQEPPGPPLVGRAPRPDPPAVAAGLRPAAEPHRAGLAAPQGQARATTAGGPTCPRWSGPPASCSTPSGPSSTARRHRPPTGP